MVNTAGSMLFAVSVNLKLLMSCPYCKAALTLNIRETHRFPVADLNAGTIYMKFSEQVSPEERKLELLCERCFRVFSFEIVKNEMNEKVIRILGEIAERRQAK